MVKNKISLYADDVMLFSTGPATTIQRLKDLLLQYGYYSGYKVNMDKNEAMDVNGQIPISVKLNSGFKWTRDGLKYLGIFIPQSTEKLYEVNYKKIIKHISEDLERWSTLPLFLIGRVESITFCPGCCIYSRCCP